MWNFDEGYKVAIFYIPIYCLIDQGDMSPIDEPKLKSLLDDRSLDEYPSCDQAPIFTWLANYPWWSYIDGKLVSFTMNVWKADVSIGSTWLTYLIYYKCELLHELIVCIINSLY